MFRLLWEICSTVICFIIPWWYLMWPSSTGWVSSHYDSPQVIDWGWPGPLWLTTQTGISSRRNLSPAPDTPRIGVPVFCVLEMFTQIESSHQDLTTLTFTSLQSQFSLKYSAVTRKKTLLFAKKWEECWQEQAGVGKCYEVHGQDDDNNGHLCHRENTNLLSVLSFPLVDWIGLWLILSWIELDLAAMSSHCKTWNSN